MPSAGADNKFEFTSEEKGRDRKKILQAVLNEYILHYTQIHIWDLYSFSLAF